MTEVVKVPSNLLDKNSVDKMLIIVFPCITKRPAYSAMKKHPLCLIFKENNAALRMEFFRDPLIRFLWKDFFIKNHENILINHLRRIRSHEEIGQTKYERFVKDLKINQTRHKITLLPNSVKSTMNVSIFTEEEALTDLEENGKRNRRQAKEIMNEIFKKRLTIA